MTTSKLNLVLIPVLVLLTICSGGLIFIVYIIIISNISNLTDFDIIAGIIFLTWMAILPLAMMLSVMRNYVTHSDKLEVNYLFGVVKYFYSYQDLKISDYRWTTKGLLIQLPDEDQMTLGKNQYRNFEEITQSLVDKYNKKKSLLSIRQNSQDYC